MSQSPSGAVDVRGRKATLRAQLLTRREQRGPVDRVSGGEAVADLLAGLPALRAAGTVAAYWGVGAEPPTAAVVERLVSAGTRVLLPVLSPGRVLDWAWFEGADQLVAPAIGPPALREPAGARLGPLGLARAEVVLLPGLAVGADGTRLGRGGGWYDAALARVPRTAPRVVLLWDEEVLAAVPAEPHDVRVDLAVTPGGTHALGASPGPAPPT